MNDLSFERAEVQAIHTALCRPPCHSLLPQPTCQLQALQQGLLILNFYLEKAKKKNPTNLKAVGAPHWISTQILLCSSGFFPSAPHVKEKCPTELHTACPYNHLQFHTLFSIHSLEEENQLGLALKSHPTEQLPGSGKRNHRITKIGKVQPSTQHHPAHR